MSALSSGLEIAPSGAGRELGFQHIGNRLCWSGCGAAVDGQAAASLAYDPRWQTAQGAYPISLTMPLSRRNHAPERVHPWLANLLPEESQLATLARRLGARGDTIAILHEIGGDTAGALSFGAPSFARNGLPLTRRYATDDPALALARHFDDRRDAPS